MLAWMNTLIGVVNSQAATLDFSKTIFFEAEFSLLNTILFFRIII